MTATIKPPDPEVKSRPIRFSSMESLGFSNPSSVWTDRRPDEEKIPKILEPNSVADWRPGEFEAQLEGGNFRWGVLLASLLVMIGIASGGIWLYLQPAAEAAASTEAVTEAATQLDSSLSALDNFNATLSGPGIESETSLLFVTDAAARALFEASGNLPPAEASTRSAAAAASSATLDGIRLAGDAHSYRLAVSPMLIAPELETDPNLIELDEAARAFGDWQLRFDNVRAALPDGVLPQLTEQLDVLSGDLTAILGDYVDALRQDDPAAAGDVVASLATRLEGVAEDLDSLMLETQGRVEQRISEAKTALRVLLDAPRT
jgi:hypothetical protein